MTSLDLKTKKLEWNKDVLMIRLPIKCLLYFAMCLNSLQQLLLA